MIATRVGYAGGLAANPTYQKVCSNRMYKDYVEALSIEYDPSLLSYGALLDAYFSYTGGVRFPRTGAAPPSNARKAPPLAASTRFRPKRQYAPVIFTHDEAQHAIALSTLGGVRERYGEIATVVEDLYQDTGTSFWDAEPYHQKWKLQKRRELTMALALPDEGGLLGSAATTLNAFAGGAIETAMARRRLQSLVDRRQLDPNTFEAVVRELERPPVKAAGAWKR